MPHPRRTALLRFVAAAFLLAVLVFTGPTGYVLLASSGRITTVAEAPAQPVAIVFGASVYSDGTPSPYLKARLDLAHAQYDAARCGLSWSPATTARWPTTRPRRCAAT